MLSRMIKIIILLAMVLAIAWGGLCVHSNFFAEPDTEMPKMPDAKEAAYGVHIENTGNLLLTNDYEVHGDEVGSRVFILHSFWEISGSDFKYRQRMLVLDEGVFGKITIRRR